MVRRNILPAFVIGLGSLLSYWSADSVRTHEWAEARLATQRVGHERVREFRRVLQSTIEVSLAIGAFFDSSQHVERDEFRRFTEPFLAAHRAILALEWVPRVVRSDRDRHEDDTRSQWRRQYRITERSSTGRLVPAGNRSEYYPVHYIEPLEGNEPAVGFDLASDADRRVALQRAATSGSVAVTGRVQLVQGEHSNAVLIFQPVYRPGMPAATVAERLSALQGLALCVVRVNDLVAPTLLRDTQGMTAVRLLDVSAKPDPELLFATAGSDRLAADSYAIDQTSEFGNRRWRLLYHQPTAGGFGRRWFWLVLLLGCGVTLVACSYLVSLRDRNDAVQEAVTIRTRELLEAKHALERRNRDIESFYHTVSHELSTPLTCINQSVSILLEGYTGELSGEQREFLETAQDSVGHMSRCIDDLLDATRLETGKLSVTMKKADLVPVVELAVRSMVMVASERGVMLDTDFPVALPLVEIDTDRIGQLLRNLLSNAIKFSEEGGTIAIRVFADDAGSGDVWVSVTDEGHGIPEDQLERVFDRHHQVRSEDTETHGGLGLGLAICREIATLHGGHIRAESEPGRGATFSFSVRRASDTRAIEIAGLSTSRDG